VIAGKKKRQGKDCKEES